MRDNTEKDGYRSNSLTMNYGYNFNNKLRLENYLYYNDSFLEYDAVNKSQTDLNVTDDQQAIYTGKIIHDHETKEYYPTTIRMYYETLLDTIILKEIIMVIEMRLIFYQNIILI